MTKSPSALITAVFLFALPLASYSGLFYGSINTKYFLATSVISLLLAWSGYQLYSGAWQPVWRRRYLLYALVLVLLAHYAASYFGVFLEKSLWSDILRSSGVLYLTLAAAFAWLLGETLEARGWQLVRRTVVLSAGVVGLLSMVSAAGLGYSETWLWIPFGIEGITFGNSTFAGVYILLAFVIGLVEFVRSYHHKRWRLIVATALALTAFSPIMFNFGLFLGKTSLTAVLDNPVLILGAARASSATMFLILAFLGGRYAINLFTSNRIRFYLNAAWAAALAAVIVGAVALLFTPGSAVQQAYIEASTEARLIVWQGGLEAVKDRPYFGWGPENYNLAHERYFNNELYQQENIGQVWFDRAHNIVVDTLVTIGYVGATALLILALVFWWTLWRVRRATLISETETIIWATLPLAHFLQLQTGFDTVPSYVLLAVIAGYVLHLERQLSSGYVAKSPGRWQGYANIGLALVLIIAALLSFKYVVYDEYVRQQALIDTFATDTPEAQRQLIEISLSQVSDWETLRMSSASFWKGAILGARETSDVEAYRENVLATAKLYDQYYEAYLEANPDHYRARMNYAYFLILQTAFGERRLEEARQLLEDSYQLSPDNPLTPSLHAIVFLYGINFDSARARVEEAKALNPDIRFSKEIEAYVERQIRRFPRPNTVLQLDNL